MPRLFSAMLVLLLFVVCWNTTTVAQSNAMFVTDSTLVEQISTTDSVEVLAVVPINGELFDLWVRTYDFEGKSVQVKDRIHHLIWDRDREYTRVYHTDTLPGLVVDRARFSVDGDLILAYKSNQIRLSRIAVEETLNWEFAISSTSAGEVASGVAVTVLPSDEFLVLLETENGAVVQHYSPGGAQLGELVLDGIGEAWDMAYAGPQFERYPIDPWVLITGSEGSVWVDARDLVVEREEAVSSRILIPVQPASELRVIGLDSTRTTWYQEPETGATDLHFAPTVAIATAIWLHYVEPSSGGGFFLNTMHFSPRYDTRMDEVLLDASFSSMTVHAMTPGMHDNGAANWSEMVFAGTTVENPGTDSSAVAVMLVHAERRTNQDLTNNSGPTIPNTIEVYPSYPNPFNSTTTVRLANAVNQYVEINVYDMLGRLVATPMSRQMLSPGYHQVTVHADRMASGMYLLIVSGDQDRARQQKITLIR